MPQTAAAAAAPAPPQAQPALEFDGIYSGALDFPLITSVEITVRNSAATIKLSNSCGINSFQSPVSLTGQLFFRSQKGIPIITGCGGLNELAFSGQIDKTGTVSVSAVQGVFKKQATLKKQ